MRSRAVTALAALVLLAGCSTAVGGRGHRGAPTTGQSTGASTSATPGTSSLPADLTHPPVHTVLGDPLTADVCAMIDENALAKFGEVIDDAGVTYAGTCAKDIQDNGSRVATVGVYVNRPSESGPTTEATRTTVTGVTVYQYPPGPSCARLVLGSDVAVRIAVVADTAAAVLCQAADVVVATVASWIASRRPLPPRAVAPSGSLTAVDVCAAATKAGLPASVPSLGHATAQSASFGSDCHYDGGDTFLSLDVAFQYLDAFDGDTQLTISGHKLYQDDHARYCQLASLQQGTGNGEQEVLVAEADANGLQTDPHLCRDASGALVGVLGVLKLS